MTIISAYLTLFWINFNIKFPFLYHFIYLFFSQKHMKVTKSIINGKGLKFNIFLNIMEDKLKYSINLPFSTETD